MAAFSWDALEKKKMPPKQMRASARAMNERTRVCFMAEERAGEGAAAEEEEAKGKGFVDIPAAP